jgi:hypothetical protein
MPKVSKQSVDYSIGMKESHCDKASEDGKGVYFIPPMCPQPI